MTAQGPPPSDAREKRRVRKIETGIPGFDFVCRGGLPAGRVTLISGTAGSGKTLFGAQFLVEGIRRSQEPGVFVTFEESPDDIRMNIDSLGWDLDQWERDGMWTFVDGSKDPGAESIMSGPYDLSALMARIESAVRRSGATRVVLDSLGAVFAQVPDSDTVRTELFRIAYALKQLGVTAILTAERTEEFGPIARFGVEDFVADNVIVLRNVLDDEKRRRSLEILKFRGTSHQKGQTPFVIVEDTGIVVLPLSAIELGQKSTGVRVTSGQPELDEICGGGFFRDSIVLVSGATGTGKTLTVTHFIAGGAAAGERCILFAFEESRDQLFRNAEGWGFDFERLEADGLLKVVCIYPESMGLDEHLIAIKDTLDKFPAHRMAIDSLSALERTSTPKSFREFVIGLTSSVKDKQVCALITSTTPTLTGGESVTEQHISTLTDSIILLRYVEMYGEMRRGLTLLKMRGSSHDKDIREFRIDSTGMHIGKPFRNVAGILAGNPRQIPPDEIERIESMFEE